MVSWYFKTSTTIIVGRTLSLHCWAQDSKPTAVDNLFISVKPYLICFWLIVWVSDCNLWLFSLQASTLFRSSSSEVFLGKLCSKFTEEHPCRSVIPKKLQSNFIEIAPQHGCSPVNLLHIFRTPFPKKHLWMAASDYCSSYPCCVFMSNSVLISF